MFISYPIALLRISRRPRLKEAPRSTWSTWGSAVHFYPVVVKHGRPGNDRVVAVHSSHWWTASFGRNLVLQCQSGEYFCRRISAARCISFFWYADDFRRRLWSLPRYRFRTILYVLIPSRDLSKKPFRHFGHRLVFFSTAHHTIGRLSLSCGQA